MNKLYLDKSVLMLIIFSINNLRLINYKNFEKLLSKKNKEILSINDATDNKDFFKSCLNQINSLLNTNKIPVNIFNLLTGIKIIKNKKLFFIELNNSDLELFNSWISILNFNIEIFRIIENLKLILIKKKIIRLLNNNNVNIKSIDSEATLKDNIIQLKNMLYISKDIKLYNSDFFNSNGTKFKNNLILKYIYSKFINNIIIQIAIKENILEEEKLKEIIRKLIEA